MSASKKNNKSTKRQDVINSTKAVDSNVLFQKIFNKWYAFSVVEGECLMTEVPEGQIPKFRHKQL